MTKTPEQIREEAERRYPMPLKENFINYGSRRFELFHDAVRAVYLKRQAFIAACNWLQSEQGEYEKELAKYPILQRNPPASLTPMVCDGENWIITGEEITPTPPQGEEGKDIPDLIARIIEQNNNPTATAKIMTLLQSELTALRSQLSEAQENYEKLDDVAEDMSDAIVRYLLSDVVDSEIIKQLEGAQDAYVKLPPPDKS
jgi:hypothetical protein